MGTVLGCGSITMIDQPNPNDEENLEQHPKSGAVRLLQILLTKSAHLVWVLRCERVIQQKNHTVNEITSR